MTSPALPASPSSHSSPLASVSAPKNFKRPRPGNGTQTENGASPSVAPRRLQREAARSSESSAPDFTSPVEWQKWEAAHEKAGGVLRSLPMLLRACGGEGSARIVTTSALKEIKAARDALFEALGCASLAFSLDDGQRKLTALRARNLKNGTTSQNLRALSKLGATWWQTLENAQTALPDDRRDYAPLMRAYAWASYDLATRPLDTEGLRELFIAAIAAHAEALQRAQNSTQVPPSFSPRSSLKSNE